MQRKWARPIPILFVLAGFCLFISIFLINSRVYAESKKFQVASPTITVATVTGTATGPIVTVRSDAEVTQINVRSGPGTEYERIGVLLVGQQAPALGRTEGGRWIEIAYPGVEGGKGWVYNSYVELSSNALAVVEAPPTPTPLMTTTIDPTLAAKFVVTSAATRLPTFTAPPALVIPTFTADHSGTPGGIPMGMVIIGIAAVGIIIGLFSLAQGR
jgi:SH3-like domain-containing protein